MHDVIVVGAGPGGASAAIALAQRGIRDVVLLDRAAFPRDKTCGSGLSPNALVQADELGVGEELRARSTPIKSVKIVTPGGRSMVLASDGEALVMLRREFDEMLVRRATSLGVVLRENAKATALERHRGRVTGVRLEGGELLEAKMVFCADGAHSIFSPDQRPKRSISTLMGWWDNAEFTPGQIEMIFDRNVAPLYGWLFPEGPTRVNIGICIDGQDESGEKTKRNVRQVFDTFLKDQFPGRLDRAEQIGRLKGHPIVYTNWVDRCTEPGAINLGEAARITHNATGEGISQAMETGIMAAEAAADVFHGRATEATTQRNYVWRLRKRFTAAFLGGHTLRAVIGSPILDGVAAAYGNPLVRKSVVRIFGSALAGSRVEETQAN